MLLRSELASASARLQSKDLCWIEASNRSPKSNGQFALRQFTISGTATADSVNQCQQLLQILVFQRRFRSSFVQRNESVTALRTFFEWPDGAGVFLG